jgi:glutamate 5-kinase
VVRVEGVFKPGDLVAIELADGTPVARGLSNYSARDIAQIRGKRTSEVRAMLADAAYDEVVHRDNLVIGKEN